MQNGSPIQPSRWKKLALAGLGIPVVVGILNAPAIRAQDGKLAFDVASVKPSKGAFVPLNFSLDPSDDYVATNGRLTADETLAEYIEFAYKPTPLEALRDQLGLKVESARASIPILVIDKVERPSEN